MNSILRCRSLFLRPLRIGNEFIKSFASVYGEVPKKRITVPQKMLKTMEKMRMKNAVAQNRHTRRPRGSVVISCKRRERNHHSGQTYSEFSPKDLASGGWKHHRSKGDYFTINAIAANPALLPIAEMEQINSFEHFNFHKELSEGLRAMNVTKPTNIQAMTIPVLMKGMNVMCAAETGSGKTLAFLLPMIEKVYRYRNMYGETQFPNRPLGVILTPSRELANQIHGVANSLASYTPFVTDVKVGGNRTQRLLKFSPEAPVDILISTPGVFSKMLSTHMYDVSRLSQIVLDEADTLLDDSFKDMIIRIIRKLKFSSESPVVDTTGNTSAAGLDLNSLSSMQIALVGATMPRSLERLLGEIVPLDTIQTISTKHLHRVMPHVPQKFVRIGPSQKLEHFLTQIKLNVEHKIPTVVFCNKSNTVSYLGQFLESNNISNIIVHGSMGHKERNGRYEQFDNGETDVIVCTDIMSRGLDTIRARQVINFEFPNFMSDYIHRVGRVGRVGSIGSCSVLSYICYKWDVDLLWQIESSARRKTELHNVNANIKRKLVSLHEKKQAEAGVEI